MATAGGLGQDAAMEPVEIVAEGLLLRCWRAEDADAVYRACQDPDIQRWTGVPSPYRASDAVGFVTDHARELWSAGTGAPLGVFDASTGALLGSGGLASIRGSRAEMGYWTAPGARGRGVATIAGRAVARWTFEQFGDVRLVWRAALGNHASRLAALRMGFRMEGLLRGDVRHDDGTREDAWVGSLRGPEEILDRTPEHLATGSVTARRAAVFGAPQPDLPLPAGLGLLRPYAETDIEQTVAACRDPDTQRWTTVPADYRRADAEHYIRAVAARSWLRGDGAVFVVATPDGAYQGACDLRISADDPEVGEVGYQIGPWARGGGLATAATRTIAAWGHDALGLRRVIWKAAVGNDRSRRVAEKAGFTIEGVERGGFVQRGSRSDAWIGSLLPTDERG